MLPVASPVFLQNASWDPQQRKRAKYFLEGLFVSWGSKGTPPKCHTVRPY